MSIQRDKKQFDNLWRKKAQNEGLSYCYKPGNNLRVDSALKILDQGKRILDIGCGDGIFLNQIRGRFIESFGIDIAEIAVETALRNGVQASILNLNSDALPYPNGFFDAITILSTFQYFYDPYYVLGECHRVLKEHGVLIMSIPNSRAIWRIYRLLIRGEFPKVSLDKIGYDGGTLHYFCYKDIDKLLKDNNFKIQLSFGIYCFPSFLSKWPDRGIFGKLKRELFSGEMMIKANICSVM